MGIPFTILMGIPFTITMGFLFTMVVGIQLTISKAQGQHRDINLPEKSRFVH